MPEEKLPPAPVRMHTRMSGSSLAWRHASSMRANIFNVIAFLRAGRLSVTVMMWLSISTSASGMVAPLVPETDLDRGSA